MGSPWDGLIRSNTGGSGSAISIFAGHLNGVTPTAGTTSTGRAHITTTSQTLRRGPGRVFALFAQAIRHTTLSDATNTFETIIGWVNSYTGNITDGAYFRWNTPGTFFQAVSRQNNTETTQTLTDPGSVETTYEVVLENAEARYLINGTLVATLTTNLPRTTTSLTFAAGVRKTGGTASRPGPRLTQLAYRIVS